MAAQEADEALQRWARRKKAEGKDTDRAVSFVCGYDKQPDGTFRAGDIVWLIVDDVVTVLDSVVPNGIALADGLRRWAAARFAMRNLGAVDEASALQLASKIECKELGRSVDIEPEKHGLERSGANRWVPAFIWAVIQAVETAPPVPSPATFMIIPRKSGVEEACVDVPADTPKRCTADGDCLPAGAEDPGAGGVLVPEPTVSGGAGAGSDYP